MYVSENKIGIRFKYYYYKITLLKGIYPKTSREVTQKPCPCNSASEASLVVQAVRTSDLAFWG